MTETTLRRLYDNFMATLMVSFNLTSNCEKLLSDVKYTTLGNSLTTVEHFTDHGVERISTYREKEMGD